MARSPYEEFPHLVSDELWLRRITSSDVNELYAMYSDEKMFQYAPGVPKKNKATVANMVDHFERDFY